MLVLTNTVQIKGSLFLDFHTWFDLKTKLLVNGTSEKFSGHLELSKIYWNSPSRGKNNVTLQVLYSSPLYGPQQVSLTKLQGPLLSLPTTQRLVDSIEVK